MDNKKKILIIHHGRDVGGGLVALVGLINELKINNEVTVLPIFNSVAVRYIRETGVHVVAPESKFYLNFYQLFVHSTAAYFDLIGCIKKNLSFVLYLLNKYYFAQKELERMPFDYDIVYLNSTFISDWALAAKCLKKKVIIHVREPLSKGLFGFRRAIIRNTIKKSCDHVIAITQDNSNRIDLPAKTTVVYDPVVKKDREKLKDIETTNSFKYFLYLGGMMRIKGFEQMVNSLDFLDDNIRIFFLGTEVHGQGNGIKHFFREVFCPYLRKQKSLAKKLRTSQKVIYVGQTDDVFSYYKESIALISPFSKSHASLPVLEAFSLGIPVIVSDVKGMDELVDGRNGLFFRNNDAESLAAAINKIAKLSKTEYNLMKIASMNTYHRLRERKASVTSVLETIENLKSHSGCMN
jgi:glycosyltransferase involved in cell wall biosynthesis